MRIFYTCLFGLLALILLQSNAGGRADVGNSGATLAPGDGNTTCASSFCHGTTNFNPQMTIEVFDLESNPITSYIPGENYTVKLTTVASGSPAGYGFQMLAVDSNDGVYNGWDGSSLPGQTQITTLAGRDYVEQTSLRTSNVAEIVWTAPQVGSGDITFYGASLAANGNGSPGGDGGTTTNVSLPENESSNTSDLNNLILSTYPNPVQDMVRVDYDRSSIAIQTLVLTDINSNRVTQVSNQDALSMSGLISGIYILHITTSEGLHQAEKIVKL